MTTHPPIDALEPDMPDEIWVYSEMSGNLSAYRNWDKFCEGTRYVREDAIQSLPNRDRAKALEYFKMICESMALDPNAKCNPELNTIMALLSIPALSSRSDIISVTQNECQETQTNLCAMGETQKDDLIKRLEALKKPLLPSGNCAANMEIKKRNGALDQAINLIREK